MEERVIPTRMELLRIKGRIRLASKGHSLLKRKRDALIMEFFKVLKEARDIRQRANEMLSKAFTALYYATVTHTQIEIESISGLTRIDYELDVKESNVMGVKIPKITFSIKREQQYPLLFTSSSIDYLIATYKGLLRVLVEVAEIETTIKRLLKEIEKTKRRVNALEYIVIPRLTHQLKEVKQRLEEMERDMFVSLKVVKRNLEKRKS